MILDGGTLVVRTVAVLVSPVGDNVTVVVVGVFVVETKVKFDADIFASEKFVLC